MKKVLAVVLAVVVLLMTIAVTPVFAAKPGTDFNGPHYTLNLVGKKADWNANGDYDHGSTIFVPQDTTAMTIDTSDDDSNTDAGYGYEPVEDIPGMKINVTQGDDFAVLDGNGFTDDDDEVGPEAAFQLPDGRYNVYMVAKGKPGGSADITGWVRAYDEELGNVYYLNIGTCSVSKVRPNSKKSIWEDATHIFEVSEQEDIFGIVTGDPVWVFDYIDDIMDPAIMGDQATAMEDADYFWSLYNDNCKLIKVRFYPR
jgi:hypothetical protein